MSGLALAGRYAKALFELATKNNSSGAVEADLSHLMKTINEFPALTAALKNPAISKKSLAKVMSELLRKIGASDLSITFIMVTVNNGRVKYIASIIDAYSALMMKSRGEQHAYVITATKLQDTQITEIEKTLSATFGSKIKAITSVNDEILGGVIVRIGSKMLDASLSGQLGELSIRNRKAIANLN